MERTLSIRAKFREKSILCGTKTKCFDFTTIALDILSCPYIEMLLHKDFWAAVSGKTGVGLTFWAAATSRT